MLQCKLCDYQIDNKAKFAKHVLYEHKLNRQNYLIQIKYNNIQPTCKCGCGELMKYNAVLSDFPSYNKHHLKTINKGKTQEEIFGNMNSPKRIEAISKTRKAKFTSGEYNYIKEVIKEGRKDPELGNKISKGVLGKPKPKPEGFGMGRKHSQTTKDKMSDSAIQRILLEPENYHTSKLEKTFSNILDLLDIKYKHFFFASKINKIFDFYLSDYHILIEVDGDFYHCNPKIYDGPVCKTQELNLKNDEIKNKWAQDNGYKLLRFWENDINNNILHVKQILLENIK